MKIELETESAFKLCDLYLSEGKISEANELYLRLTQKFPKNGEVYLRYANLKYIEEDW